MLDREQVFCGLLCPLVIVMMLILDMRAKKKTERGLHWVCLFGREEPTLLGWGVEGGRVGLRACFFFFPGKLCLLGIPRSLRIPVYMYGPMYIGTASYVVSGRGQTSAGGVGLVQPVVSAPPGQRQKGGRGKNNKQWPPLVFSE